jgi:hypothetical protein
VARLAVVVVATSRGWVVGRATRVVPRETKGRGLWLVVALVFVIVFVLGRVTRVVVATAGLALGVASSRGDGRCRKVRRDGATAVAGSLVVAAGPARDTAKAAIPRRVTRRSRTHNVSEDEQTLMLLNRPLGRVPLACACLPGCLGPKTDLRREQEADGRCHEGFNADLSDIIGVSFAKIDVVNPNSRVTRTTNNNYSYEP